MAAHPSDPLYARGWAPDTQSDEWPKLSDEAMGAQAVFEELVDGSWQLADGSSDGRWRLEGQVFVDGSCLPGQAKALWRAGWGVVQVDASGHPVRRAYGVVPRHLPQNAVSAEWAALSVAVQYVAPESEDGMATIWQDCPAVTDEWRRPWAKRLRHGSKYAGMCRALWGYDGGLSQ